MIAHSATMSTCGVRACGLNWDHLSIDHRSGQPPSTDGAASHHLLECAYIMYKEIVLERMRFFLPPPSH